MQLLTMSKNFNKNDTSSNMNRFSASESKSYPTLSSTSSTFITADTFSSNMPKLVQGVAFLENSNRLKIEIRYKYDTEYDRIVNILDADGSKNFTADYSNNGEVSLLYKKWTKRKTYKKSLTLIFASGDSKRIELTVPGKNSKLESSIQDISSIMSSSPYDNLLALSTGIQSDNTLVSSVIPKQDPYNVFNYDKVFVNKLPFVYYVNSDSLNEIFIKDGVKSSVSSVEEGESLRGVGHLHPAPAEQEIHFVNVITSLTDNLKTRKDLLSKLNTSIFTYGFIYGKNLINIPDDAPTFYVCKNEGDASNWITTGKDCDGTTIDTRYRTGEEPAVFLDGNCCSSICDSFSIQVRNTSDLDAKFGLNVGKIKVFITGGQGDFSINITNSATGLNTTTSITGDEHEFTSLAFAESNQSPYKIVVTDANSCKATSYIQLGRIRRDESTLIQGCTDSNSLLHDSSATYNTGCLYCQSLGPRGEKYGGLAFGISSATAKATGEELIVNQHSSVVDATADGAMGNGKIYFRGSVHPAALPVINQDADVSYRLALYNLGNTEDANSLTKAQVLALSTSNQDGDLEHEWSSLATGWYAVAASVLNVPSLADCVSVYRFYVGYGGCTDTYASNYDKKATYLSQSACEYNCEEKNVKIVVTDTVSKCIKTVHVPKSKKDNNVTWNIGSSKKYGAGPHLVESGAYVSVYVENTRTKCTDSGEIYIKKEECEGQATPRSAMSRMAVNTGGCTDDIAFNYDCEAIWDDGSCIPVIAGCMDQTANNYNASANIDDGSCIDDIVGCLAPNAINYNPFATINDMSMCMWPNINVSGLMPEEQDAMFFNVWPNLLCPVEGTAYDVNATANGLRAVTLRIPVATTIELGSELVAYKLPVGGNNSIAGLTLNDLSFPLETSGLPVSAVWKMTGTDANIFTDFTNNSGNPQGCPWWAGFNTSSSPNVFAIYNQTTGTLTTSPTNTGGNLMFAGTGFGNVGLAPTVWEPDEGSIGFGLYMFELKLVYNGLNHYHRTIDLVPSQSLSSPCNSNSSDSAVPSYQTGIGLGCVSDTSLNYTPNVGLNINFLQNIINNLSPESGNSNSTITNLGWQSQTQVGSDGPINFSSSSAGLAIMDNWLNANWNGPCLEGEGGKMCLPPRLKDKLNYLDNCLMNSTVNWYRNHITGGKDLCEDIALWTTILMRYLLGRVGLDCIYNCSDISTPELVQTTCEQKWENGGSLVWTYTNELTYEGTGNFTSGQYVKFNTVLPWMGDTPPNTIWKVMSDCGTDCDNPYGVGFDQGNWELCRDLKSFPANPVNYIDNFFKFATRYCKSCDPCSFKTGNENSFDITGESIIFNSEDNSNLSIGGLNLEIDGENYNG
tara:strand:- start:3863 stop:7930 length:4068 start_codon:yes stop_codon:yes gene_type:complete